MLKFRRISFSYERGRQVLLFLFCLFLAFVIWSVHKLSGDFSTYFNYRVHLKTVINGRDAEAVSENLMTLRIRAGGFYILKQKFTREWPSVFLNVDYRQLNRVPGNEGHYSLISTNLRENIREALGESIVMESVVSDTLLFVLTRENSYKE
ncbi:MAG: hypothetical protein PHV14_11685 [Bacteroidales bacterium]|nr:hypothetical protein [Bacteroidales bacterium]MDD2426144.1 hypothetical protein [Bacteroidales bacterium]MDD3812936.1 hypothetical protein [Bacteroidales bacterium]MDD3989769.1 hypothetical protein [Bacteroidales bacterium]